MRKADIALFGGIAAVIAVLAFTVDIKTPAEYYALHPTEITEDGAYVTIKVDCSAVADRSSELPADGTILNGRYALANGESVYDVTARVLRHEEIPFDVTGGKNVYISGISGLYELDYGAESGWIYTVNGTAPDINCGEYEPVSGDEIEFVYIDSYFGGER